MEMWKDKTYLRVEGMNTIIWEESFYENKTDSSEENITLISDSALACTIMSRLCHVTIWLICTITMLNIEPRITRDVG